MTKNRPPSYEKTTPVGRVLKNVEKARAACALAATKLRAWAGACGEEAAALLGVSEVLLARSARDVEEASAALDRAAANVAMLKGRGWSPATATQARQAKGFREGAGLVVKEKYRARYAEVYTGEGHAGSIDQFFVEKVLKSGDLLVESYDGDAHFIAPRRHFVAREPVPAARGGSSLTYPPAPANVFPSSILEPGVELPNGPGDASTVVKNLGTGDAIRARLGWEPLDEEQRRQSLAHNMDRLRNT